MKDLKAKTETKKVEHPQVDLSSGDASAALEREQFESSAHDDSIGVRRRKNTTEDDRRYSFENGESEVCVSDSHTTGKPEIEDIGADGEN